MWNSYNLDGYNGLGGRLGYGSRVLGGKPLPGYGRGLARFGGGYGATGSRVLGPRRRAYSMGGGLDPRAQSFRPYGSLDPRAGQFYPRGMNPRARAFNYGGG
jgi:hypothetical protein